MIAVGAAWLYPADSYLLLPDSAKPLAPLVKVEGEKPHPPGEILYVDVIVRQASVLEELLPFTRPDGADLVPKSAIVPPGSNYQERRRQNLRQMDRSQKIAAAVALRELGYKVVAKPEGALIVDVAPGLARRRQDRGNRGHRRRRRQAGEDARRPAPADRKAQAR